MSKIQKMRLLNLLVIVVVVALFFPVIFGEPRKIIDQSGGDIWRNFVYDFQTLIGGLAAVAAAAYTVRQMRASDIKSDRRHSELISLSLRSDRLRVERLIFPSFQDLVTCCDAVEEFNVDSLRQLIEHEPKTIVGLLKELQKNGAEITKVLDRKPFKESADLFDGPLAYQFDQALRHNKRMIERCTAGVMACHGLATAIERRDAEKIKSAISLIAVELDRLERDKGNLVFSLVEVGSSMEEMGKLYRIHDTLLML